MSKTQQLLAAATPAPWHGHTECCSVVFGPVSSDSPHVAETFAGTPQRFVNRDLIVHLRNTADAAQAVIEAARTINVWVEQYGKATIDGGQWSELRAALAVYDETDRG